MRGSRRATTVCTSRHAAPIGLVTTPTRRGVGGSARLRSSAKSPSAVSRRFSASRRRNASPAPAGTDVVDAELAAAVAVIELDPPVREDLRPVARRERDLRRLRREQHALQLADVVAQREVHVTRGRRLRLKDLALDPQVLELVAGLDVLGQPDRELTDAQDVLRRARDTHPSACRP